MAVTARLSVIWCENGLPCRTAPRCRRFSVRDAGDLATYFVTSVQLGVVLPDPHAGATGLLCSLWGFSAPATDSCRHCRRFANCQVIYDQLTKRQVITVHDY